MLALLKEKDIADKTAEVLSKLFSQRTTTLVVFS